jgi:cytosine/adenosine deaminase-related metal-dependent hydrolase
MRLASGIAPIWEYLKAGVNIGIGVDGSASNDSSHLLAEARQAMLLARVRAGLEGASLSGSESPILTARQALEIATLGGARVLGRSDIGSLEVDKCADFIAIDLHQVGFTGALSDPVAAILFCNPVTVNYNVVGGKFIIKDGELQTLDLPVHIEKHNKAAHRLLESI